MAKDSPERKICGVQQLPLAKSKTYPYTNRSVEMWYSSTNGTYSINCAPKRHIDGFGTGVRGPLYLQVLFAIVRFVRSSRDSIIMTNSTLGSTALALIATAYFDPAIDIPSTIICSQLAMMLSLCRNTSAEFDLRFMHSQSGLETIGKLWFIDACFRPLQLMFNYHLWQVLRTLKPQDYCPDGIVGLWMFGRTVQETGAPSANYFLYLSVLDAAWEYCRICLEVARILNLRNHKGIALVRQVCFNRNGRWTWDGDSAVRLRIVESRLETIFSFSVLFWHVYRIACCAYLIWATERTILVNNLPAGGGVYGEVFAMAQAVGMFYILVFGFFRLLKALTLGDSGWKFPDLRQSIGPVYRAIVFNMFKWFSIPIETTLNILFNPNFYMYWDPSSRLQFSAIVITYFLSILFLGLPILDLFHTFLLLLGMSIFYWELFNFLELFVKLKKV